MWLDAAELLEPVAHAETRWIALRMLTSTDVDTVAERLRATPVPCDADMPKAFGGPR